MNSFNLDSTISLSTHIGGQDEAVKTLIDTFSAWQLRRQSDTFEPLNLAFTGPSGTIYKHNYVKTTKVLLTLFEICHFRCG